MILHKLFLVLLVLISQAHANDVVRYSVTDRTLEGEYSFYQEAIDPEYNPAGGDLSRAQLEMMVSDRLKKCADESDRCSLMSLQWTAETGSFQLGLVMLDGEAKQETIYLKLEEAQDGSLVAEKSYDYEKTALDDDYRLSRVSIQIKPFQAKSGMINPQITVKTEAVKKGWYDGVYLNRTSQLLMRQEDKED